MAPRNTKLIKGNKGKMLQDNDAKMRKRAEDAKTKIFKNLANPDGGKTGMGLDDEKMKTPKTPKKNSKKKATPPPPPMRRPKNNDGVSFDFTQGPPLTTDGTKLGDRKKLMAGGKVKKMMAGGKVKKMMAGGKVKKMMGGGMAKGTMMKYRGGGIVKQGVRPTKYI